MTKAPAPTEKSKKQRNNIKNATKNFDYTTIADRLRTVSWSNSSQSTGVVKPVYEHSTFPLTAKAVQSKGHMKEYFADLRSQNACFEHMQKMQKLKINFNILCFNKCKWC